MFVAYHIITVNYEMIGQLLNLSVISFYYVSKCYAEILLNHAVLVVGLMLKINVQNEFYGLTFHEACKVGYYVISSRYNYFIDESQGCQLSSFERETHAFQ